MTTASLRDIAVLITLSMGGYTPSKVDRAETKKLRDTHGTTAGKVIVDYLTGTRAGEVLARINTAKNEASAAWKRKTVRWDDAGRRMAPNDTAYDLLQTLASHRTTIEALASELASVWPYAEQEARAAFNGLWKASYADEYRQSPCDIAARFTVDVTVEPLPSVSDIRISAPDAILAQVREQAEQALQDKFRNACREPFEKLQKVIEHIHTTLSDPKAGFHESLFGNLSALVEVLPTLNIGKDSELDRIAREAKARLLAFDLPAMFGNQEPSAAVLTRKAKDDPAHRASTARAAGAILADLNAYMGGTQRAAA